MPPEISSRSQIEMWHNAHGGLATWQAAVSLARPERFLPSICDSDYPSVPLQQDMTA